MSLSISQIKKEGKIIQKLADKIETNEFETERIPKYSRKSKCNIEFDNIYYIL